MREVEELAPATADDPAKPGVSVNAADSAKASMEEMASSGTAKERTGWMLEGETCSRCSKKVIAQGGVVCGRLRPSGVVVGCGAAVCWRCMKKKTDGFGSVKTTKAEFASLGDDAWWMHEKCMSTEDLAEYYDDDERQDSAQADQ